MLSRRAAIKSLALGGVSLAASSCLSAHSGQRAFSATRRSRPRLYHPADDPDYRFGLPTDPVRKRILQSIISDCEELSIRKVWPSIPEVWNSPYPFHQLYVTFYSSMEASALIEQYAFAWRMTHDERWLAKAKEWLMASVGWKHGDAIDEEAYSADRYMGAYATALDWLAGGLTGEEEARVEKCLVQMMYRWWPEIDKHRHDPAGGNHPAVDNGHFGMAALQLLGHHPDASEWVSAVVDRFRAAIMPHGCGEGGMPDDGISFWADENIEMLQFCDALRNVVGIDLYKEFPERLPKSLMWARYCVVPPRQISAQRYAQVDSSCLTGRGADQLDAYSAALLRLAQEERDERMRDLALRDPLLGRVHPTGHGVKNSTAECMVSWGPFAYLYYDPSFKPSRRHVSYPLSKSFAGSNYGTVTFMRSSWAQEALVAQLLGYDGHVAQGFSTLHIQYKGYPVTKTIEAAEAGSVNCGNLPCVGGQDEFVGLIGELESTPVGDKVSVEGARTRQEYWVLRGEAPALLIATRRKPRGIKLMRDEGKAYVRLDGKDYLQYPREPYFNPGAGELRVRIRLRHVVEASRPQMIFNTGMGVANTGLGTEVNEFTLGFFGEKGLTFAVTSHDFLTEKVNIPPSQAAAVPGQWHDVVARWGGLNDSPGKPFIELELDGHRQRFDNPSAFGEMGVDTEKMKIPRTTPLPFIVKPHTVLAFGAAVQIPGTGLACDLAAIQLICPRRQHLTLDFNRSMGDETGSGKLQWKLNPVNLMGMSDHGAILGAGPDDRLRVMALQPGDATFGQELVPFAPSGLAAASIRLFRKGATDPSIRLLATSEEDAEDLILLFVDQRSKVSLRPKSGGFGLTLDGTTYTFGPSSGGTHILKLIL